MQKFLPKGVLKSSRAHYLEMIGAACSYLLDMDINLDQYKKKKNDKLKEKKRNATVKSFNLDPCYMPNDNKGEKKAKDSDSDSDDYSDLEF